ncbi:MAG TPA: hypothetical protein VM934_03655 [Pyrinomonadaceae bacterium]|jgi:hypothetical protein|nr:hypothetical protein [Pyrinomonadaceae bacterium]
MITVELDIFSGNPNPKWALSKREADNLLDRVMADRSLASPPQTVGGLGYRGFVVSADEPRWKRANLPSRFYVSAQESVDTERALLNSANAGRSVKDDVRQAAQDSMESTHRVWAQLWSDFAQGKVARPRGEGPGPVIGSPKSDIPPDTPPQVEEGGFSAAACGTVVYSSDVNFSFWNGDSYSQLNNNCYNFASNYKSNTFAQPGRKSNVPNSLDCGNYYGAMGYAAAYDGHTNACWAGNEYLTCFVIWPGNDYHWYRLCANGHWCHKPGSTPARNYDNSGFWITDPYYCNRGNYTVFCSYRYFPHGWSVV